MVPTRTGKPGKMRKLFPISKKSGNFDQTGKVREFWAKYWKNEEILASFYFYFLSDFLIEVYSLNRFWCLLNSLNKMLKKYSGKWKENTGKSGKSQGNLSVRKCGNHDLSNLLCTRLSFCEIIIGKEVSIVLDICTETMSSIFNFFVTKK